LIRALQLNFRKVAIKKLQFMIDNKNLLISVASINSLTLTIMKKVLIIDDDPDVRTVMDVLMKKQGYGVETAFNREDALDKLEHFQPSVILLDVLLSGTDGRQLCREIKSADKTRHVPVIMVSAHPGAADNIGNYGADDFISKPINTETLLEKMDKLINEIK
jgi:DNA-binding response OmpR family regulator